MLYFKPKGGNEGKLAREWNKAAADQSTRPSKKRNHLGTQQASGPGTPALLGMHTSLTQRQYYHNDTTLDLLTLVVSRVRVTSMVAESSFLPASPL